MPLLRKPVSPPTCAFMPAHRRRLSMASGNSARSRPIVRHQPQFRLDCSPAMRPFSHSVTETPFLARWSAALTPTMPPPTTTTSARAGRAFDCMMAKLPRADLSESRLTAWASDVANRSGRPVCVAKRSNPGFSRRPASDFAAPRPADVAVRRNGNCTTVVANPSRGTLVERWIARCARNDGKRFASEAKRSRLSRDLLAAFARASLAPRVVALTTSRTVVADESKALSL